MERQARKLTDIEKQIYKEGVKIGISLYAVWHNGTQYVGDGHKTKGQALEDVDKSQAPSLLWLPE